MAEWAQGWVKFQSLQEIECQLEHDIRVEAQATEGAAFAEGLARSCEPLREDDEARLDRCALRRTRATESNRRPDTASLTCNRSSNCQNADLRTCGGAAGIL